MRQFRPDYWKRILRQDQRIEEVERDKKERQDQAEGRKELGLRIPRSLEAGQLAKDLELEVEDVSHRYRQVRLRGYDSKIKAHRDFSGSHENAFNIVRSSIYPSSLDDNGKKCLTLTFGRDAGLEKYLEFNGW